MMPGEREKKLEQALAQFIKPIKGIPLEVIIKSLFDYEVLPFDRNEKNNQQLLKNLTEAMRAVCKTVQTKPIKRPRPNEVGNDMEPLVIEALCKQGLKAAPPKTASGKGKATAYPDIQINTVAGVIYLEVKTYAKKNYSTSQRSFYLSPSDDPKITCDAWHLAVGFEVERDGNHFFPVAFDIVDLYGLDCDMKSEFNSDNKRLYRAKHILVKETVEIV